MKGLIIKDFINLKQQVKMMVVLLFFYLVFGIVTKSTSIFSSVLIVYSVIIPLTIFGYDEKAKWDRYALTMPVSRKDLVLSKYLVYLIINLALTIISIIGLVATGATLLETLAMALMVACIGWVYISISYPIIFHFGVEKARIVTMILMVVAMIVFTAGGEILSSFSTSMQGIIQYIALPLLTIVIVAISVMGSYRIIAKKEF